MEDNRQNQKKRKTIAAIIAVASVVIIIFVCIFSLYHLPERDPVETPQWDENATVAESPAEDFEATNDVMSASQEQVSEMLGSLEMQYENAKLNNEPYAAEQAGMRLALAYWKAGQTENAVTLTNSLIQNYSYDESFVAKCKELLHTMESASNQEGLSSK